MGTGGIPGRGWVKLQFRGPACGSSEPRTNTPTPESVQVLDELKAQGHDVTVLTFVGAGHGLLDNPPTDPDATPSLIGWVTSHDR